MPEVSAREIIDVLWAQRLPHKYSPDFVEIELPPRSDAGAWKPFRMSWPVGPAIKVYD